MVRIPGTTFSDHVPKIDWEKAYHDLVEHIMRVMKADKLNLDQTQELLDFVIDIGKGPHDDICPLNHPAYRNKWCNCCEAKKLADRLAAGESNAE